MSEAKDAYDRRRAMKDAEQERWEKQNEDRLAQERVGAEIVSALADLLTGRKVIYSEVVNDHTTRWSVATP